MRDRLSGSNTQRFANFCSKIRELKKEAREKNGYDLVAVLVNDQKAPNGGSSRSTFTSGSRQALSLEHPDTAESYDRLRTGRQLEVLADDDGSVSEDEYSINSESAQATAVNELYRETGSIRSCKRARPDHLYMNVVKTAIVERAADVGFIITSQKLPWRRLPERCARHGVYIDNYPNGVVSPFGNEKNSCYHGLQTLTSGEHKALLRALMDEKLYPMQFLSERRPFDILNNRQPVIVYAPPPFNSDYERSKRIFLDGSYDYQGHPRIGFLSEQTARKRCLENPSAHKPDKRRRLDRGEASIKFMDS